MVKNLGQLNSPYPLVTVQAPELKQVDAYIAGRLAAGDYEEAAKRTGTHPLVIENDDRYGKDSEFVAEETMSPYFTTITKPDCKVIPKNQKTHGADLLATWYGQNIKVVVKSCQIPYQYPWSPSWIFANSNLNKKPGGKDHLSLSSKEPCLFCFVMWHDNTNQGRIAAIVHKQDIFKHNLFKLLKLDNRYRNGQPTKLAIYWDDVERLKLDIFEELQFQIRYNSPLGKVVLPLEPVQATTAIPWKGTMINIPV